MQKLILVLIFLAVAISLMTFVSYSSLSENTIIIYYNGTVIANLHGVDNFTLIGYNITDLRVIGSSYKIVGKEMYFTGNTTSVFIKYNSKLPGGVITVNESYPVTVYVIVPTNISLTYIQPQPYSFQVFGKFYNITFVNINSLTLLYTFNLKPYTTTNKSQSSLLNSLLIPFLSVLDIIVSGLFIYTLIQRRKSEKIEEPETEIVTEVLDERDKLVLEAIKNGATTLAEVVRRTNLPKATAYRRIKKLVSLGYVEEIREGGKVRYAPKNK